MRKLVFLASFGFLLYLLFTSIAALFVHKADASGRCTTDTECMEAFGGDGSPAPPRRGGGTGRIEWDGMVGNDQFVVKAFAIYHSNGRLYQVVPAKPGTMRLTGLPKGCYRMTTWGHKKGWIPEIVESYSAREFCIGSRK